jgi:hypothetical protein
MRHTLSVTLALAFSASLAVAGSVMAQGKISDDAVRIGVLTDMSGL